MGPRIHFWTFFTVKSRQTIRAQQGGLNGGGGGGGGGEGAPVCVVFPL